jgi:beta-lactam-binding protein with PASTA domain
VRKLTRFHLNARMAGDGFVTAQDPAPGTPVREDSVCRLTLSRQPAYAGAGTGGQ